MSTRTNAAEILGREFFSQDFSGEQIYAGQLEKYKQTAAGYARIENAVAVLSDLHAGTSYIYYGGFAQLLGTSYPETADTVQSIWEEEILQLLPAEDLEEKQIQELRFLHFARQQPKKRRCDYCLASALRMRARSGGYITTLHRIFYIPRTLGQQFLARALPLQPSHALPSGEIPDNQHGRRKHPRPRAAGRCRHPLTKGEAGARPDRPGNDEQGDSSTPVDQHPYRQPPPSGNTRQAPGKELRRRLPHCKDTEPDTIGTVPALIHSVANSVANSPEIYAILALTPQEDSAAERRSPEP